MTPRKFDDELRSAVYEPMSGELCSVRPVDVHFSGEPRLFLWGRALSAILREDWDMVHLWEEPYVVGGIQPALSLAKATPFVFATFQNIPKQHPFPFNVLEKAVVRRARGWIAFGETVAQAHANRPGYDERPTKVIPPAVDVDVFCPNPVRGVAIRRQFGWSDDSTPTIGFLGRFVPEKGLSLLMATLDELRCPWRALFVGTGPLERDLRNWSERHLGRVAIATTVRHQEVPAYLNAMSFLVAPSLTTRNWREQFGRMIVEAFACGVAVVASDSGELPYTVGDAGLIVPEGDQPSWTRTLEELLVAPERRNYLSAKGRARAVSHFAWPLVARATIEFFDQLLTSNASTAGSGRHHSHG